MRVRMTTRPPEDHAWHGEARVKGGVLRGATTAAAHHCQPRRPRPTSTMGDPCNTADVPSIQPGLMEVAYVITAGLPPEKRNDEERTSLTQASISSGASGIVG